MTPLAPMEAALSRRRLTDLLVESVSQFSPPNAEGPATQVFAEALREGGIPYRLQPVPGAAGDPGRANLVVQLGPDPVGLHLVGHVDTIDLGFDAELRVRRDGDLLYGLGTADMKSGCAAMVEALTAVVASEVELTRGVRLSLLVGEEDYGDGAEALIADDLEPVPLTLIGEPTRLIPCIDHYGYAEYRLSGEGQRAHAALPERGANAIHATLAWVTEVLTGLEALPYGDRTAVSLREIRGGTSLFVTADACEVLLDIHLPPEVGVDDVVALIERTRAEVDGRHPGCTLEAEQDWWAPGYVAGPGNGAAETLAQAFAAVGRPFAPGVFRSHSDANLFRDAGTVPVICGPGALEVAHTDDEHVSLTETFEAARLYAALIDRCCSG